MYLQNTGQFHQKKIIDSDSLPFFPALLFGDAACLFHG
jgi:hypothetical protein